mgnify:CR=1 FL=1
MNLYIFFRESSQKLSINNFNSTSGNDTSTRSTFDISSLEQVWLNNVFNRVYLLREKCRKCGESLVFWGFSRVWHESLEVGSVKRRKSILINAKLIEEYVQCWSINLSV